MKKSGILLILGSIAVFTISIFCSNYYPNWGLIANISRSSIVFSSGHNVHIVVAPAPSSSLQYIQPPDAKILYQWLDSNGKLVISDIPPIGLEVPEGFKYKATNQDGTWTVEARTRIERRGSFAIPLKIPVSISILFALTGIALILFKVKSQ